MSQELTVVLGGIALVAGALLLSLLLHHLKNLERQRLLFLQLGLTYSLNGLTIYPTFTRKRNKLILKKYNPGITSKDFNEKELKAFSKVFSKNEEDSFVLAEYEKAGWISRIIFNYNRNSLVLYTSKIKETDFFKDCPKLELYNFWVGRDLKNNEAIFSLKNKNAISIFGKMGLGKSNLANCIITSLNQSTEKEYVFTKSRADYIKGHQTMFCSKDDELKMLKILKMVKEQALKKQQELDEANIQNIFQLKQKLTVLLFDECHSYLSPSQSLNKEEKQTRTEIISLVSWFLKQGRSIGIIVIFILPSAERAELSINVREVAYIFSTKIPSEIVSNNIFNSPIASLIPSKQGLFVVSDDFETRLVQVAEIQRKS